MASRKSKVAQPLPGEPIALRWTRDGRPRYYVRVNVGTSPDGRRKQARSAHDSLTAARSAVSQVRTDRERGMLLERTRQTFGEAADDWLSGRKARVRGVTYVGYEAMVVGLKSDLASKPLVKVTKADVEKFVAKLAVNGKARATASRYLFVLRAIFADAVDAGVVNRNPALRVEAAGRDPRPRLALSSAEAGKLQAHFAADALFACWLLTLYGLRRSEVLGLMWSDVDLSAGTVSIARSRVAVNGSMTEVGPTKTKRGTRTLPLPDDVLAALRAMREQQAAAFGFEHVRSSYLAVDVIRKPMRHERWTDLWARACTATRASPRCRCTVHAIRQ